jgi:prolyl-tRNA synthetase
MGILLKQERLVLSRRFVHRQVLSKMFPAVDIKDLSAKSPGDSAGCISHKLMVQHRLIQGASSGTFYILPSLMRSLEKLYRIIDQEMYAVGAQKLTLTCLAPKQLWQTSDRWLKMGSELFTLKDRNGAEHCLAPTHEEAITSIVAADGIVSYKRLPIRLYQIGRKYRDEGRPKHGLMRCREFEMKDLYTFDADATSAEVTYLEVCEAYRRLLNRLGVPFVTVEASSGAMGGVKSQEFHLLSPVGEDVLYCCQHCGRGVNQEVIENSNKPVMSCIQKDCPSSYQEKTGIEVAHAFILGTTYSEVFNACYVDKMRNKRPLYMDCFGIGVTRLLAASLEVLSSGDEVRWPKLLAPYQICIIPQKEGYKSEVTNSLAESLYDELTGRFSSLRQEVVIDDRLHLSIGQRVKQAQAAGYPHLCVLGRQALSEPPLFEYIDVYNGSVQHVDRQQLLNTLAAIETV